MHFFPDTFVTSLPQLDMLKAIFVINNEPIPIVAKMQRGDVEPEISEEICNIIRDQEKICSVMNNQNHSFCIKKSGEIWLVAVVDGDGFAMLYLSMLDQIENLLHQYVENPLTDFGVKDNFAIIYRLLDIFTDCGYPLVDDYNGMMQFIQVKGKNGEKGQPNLVYPWRTSEITYKKQQVLIDVVEYIDYCMGANGKVDLQQIRGEINVLAEVNGNPKCSFQWKNAPYFEDIAFHRCVDIANFQNSRRLELIPPQGRCTIVNYRMQQQTKPPLDLKIAFVPTRGKMDIRITATAEKDLTDLKIRWSVLKPGASTLSTKNGSLSTSGNELTWTIGGLKNTKTAELSGVIDCDETCRQTTFIVDFKIDGQLASGCEMGTVQLDNADSAAFVGAKYETRCGRYQIRAGLA